MSPRNKEQNEQIRQERRAAILQAAIPLFTLNGYSATSMSEVAKAAGVSHGTIFLYFPTKEDLFRAALAEPLAEAEQTFFRTLTQSGTPRERIERMVREQITFSRQMVPFIRLTQYVIGQRERFPELAQLCFAFGNRFTETLIPIIAEGQRLGQLAKLDPVGVAVAYFSYINGLSLILIESPEGLWEEATAAALRLFAPLE